MKAKKNRQQLETNSILKNIFNRFLIHPILNSLPAKSQKYIRKTHSDANEIIENKTTHKALEVLYRGGYREYSKSLKENFFRFIWMQTDNAKGVRNRLKITERELLKYLLFLIKEKKEKRIRILSIASGSARSFLYVLKKVSEEKNTVPIHVTFLDKDLSALAYSKRLIESENFDKKIFSFEWVENTANTYLSGLNDNDCYHLVEMVGLLDYFTNEKVIQTVHSIHEHLFDGGVLITANIIPNKEKPFVTNAVGWRMIYRQPDEFVHLVNESSFRKEHIKKYIEPMNVHAVLVATKFNGNNS